jgi:hypothetical protein
MHMVHLGYIVYCQTWCKIRDVYIISTGSILPIRYKLWDSDSRIKMNLNNA